MIVSECPDCAAASNQRHWCGYRSDCISCRARLIAGSPQYFVSELACRIMPDYKAKLATMGAESIEAAHKLCRQWRDRLDALPIDGP